jgi:hypothetical protein
VQLAVLSGEIVVLDPRVNEYLGVEGSGAPVLSSADIAGIKRRRTENPVCRQCERPVLIVRWPGDDARFYFRHRAGDLEPCIVIRDPYLRAATAGP